MNHQDVFQPVATGAVPANIKSRHDHPVENKHVSKNYSVFEAFLTE